MGRKLVLTVLATVMLAVPVAFAGDTPGDGTLSVKRGRGLITLTFTGTMIGRINARRIWVRDYDRFDNTNPKLQGCKPKVSTLGTYVCQGRNLNISFRLLDGKYGVYLRGAGIFLSAAGYGKGTVDGKGDTGVNDGVWSFNDGPYRSLPNDLQTFELQAPPGG
jgi:hypothetical protein